MDSSAMPQDLYVFTMFWAQEVFLSKYIEANSYFTRAEILFYSKINEQHSDLCPLLKKWVL